MPDHYDALEIRDPAARERETFARLPETITRAGLAQYDYILENGRVVMDGEARALRK
jgi:hypothetical protein